MQKLSEYQKSQLFNGIKKLVKILPVKCTVLLKTTTFKARMDIITSFI